MKKLIACGAAAVLGLGALPLAAQADDAEVSVEGRAYTLGTPAVAANRNTVHWGCVGAVTGATAVTTTVTCSLVQRGVVVSTQTATADGNVAATTPVSNEISFSSLPKYCWTAEATLADGTRIADTTSSNCI